MPFTRQQVEQHLKSAEAKATDVASNVREGVVKKSPQWRQASAEVKKWKKRLTAITKLEEREAGLKKD